MRTLSYFFAAAALLVSLVASVSGQNPTGKDVPVPFFDPLVVDNYHGRYRDIKATGYFSQMVRAIHPPRVQWEHVEGVVTYRLVLTQNRKVLGVAEANASPYVMREGWEKL